MKTFFRLFGDHWFGLWFPALILFAVQEIPYMLMPLFKPDPNPIMNLPEHYKPLAVAEGILGSACIALMFLVVNKNTSVFGIGDGAQKVFFILACAVLTANFIGWGIYFAGTRTNAVMLIFIVLMPPLYYLFIGLWRQNYILAGTAAVFLCVHFTHVYLNLHAE